MHAFDCIATGHGADWLARGKRCANIASRSLNREGAWCLAAYLRG